MSTLKVDTIQHSGGTTGLTIDSSGNVDLGAGSIVQIVTRQVDTYLDHTHSGTTQTDIPDIYIDITPRFNNSIILWRTIVFPKLDDEDGYIRYRVVDSNDSDAVFHSTTYCASSNYYANTSAFVNVPIESIKTSSGTTSTMRLQLQCQVNSGGTATFNWSDSNGQVVVATEIRS